MSLRRVPRRTVLYLGVTSVGVTVGSGCLAGLPFNCPDRDLQNELPYKKWAFDRILNRPEAGAFLVTNPEGVDRFDAPTLDGDRGWLRDTAFDKYVLIGVQVGTTQQSTDLYITGVARPDDETIHVYSCIPHQTGGDAGNVRAAILRVPHHDRVPDRAILTHWSEGNEHTYRTPTG